MNMPFDYMKHLLETTVAFVERTGVKALELEPRRVRLMAPLRGNENHIGTMYAGALFTLAEVPVGALYLTTFDVSKYYPIIKEMTIQFVRPAKTDATIELVISEEEVRRIQAEVDAQGKADFILEGQVKDTAGEVVVTSRGTYQLRAIGK
ncbi:MAG: YiiD C-terminal domain-containing protein [Desulfomonilaceae bacterium]|nr:YiiD C-terminal domain-containing protein [Desulfomonilaceae bacterium]